MITVDVAYSANYQLVVSNTTPQPVTFLADSGEPFLEIGPEGVRGNFASPTFFNSNNPGGRDSFPPAGEARRRRPADLAEAVQAEELGLVRPPAPPDGELPSRPRSSTPGRWPVLGRWRVPLRYGDQTGELQGRFEFRPVLGSYAMVQKSPKEPAPGVTVQVVSGSVVPAFFVKNESPTPVVVLGGQGEPFARIGAQGGVTEVNVKSQTWVEIQQALGKDPSDEADAAAEPKWQQVASTPAWNWLEFRAAAPKSDPPQAVIERGKAVTVKTWSIPYLIGERRGSIDGITEWVPIAELQERAGGGSAGRIEGRRIERRGIRRGGPGGRRPWAPDLVGNVRRLAADGLREGRRGNRGRREPDGAQHAAGGPDRP